MTAALEGAVELLERSLGYTRVMLSDVGSHHLAAPTPCAGWDLRRLLAHMDDGLDAFIEAAAGRVEVDPVPPTHDPVDSLREKACALLGAWTRARPSTVPVTVGDRELDGPVLVATAALEIAVHGWDVAQATGRGTPIPADLARDLLLIAEQRIGPADRGTQFAAPEQVTPSTVPSDIVVAYLGRRTGPLGWNTAEPPSHRGIAS